MIAVNLKHPPPHIHDSSLNSHNPHFLNFCFFNINSLQATAPGGIAGPFLKQIQTLTYLSFSNDLIYV